LNRIWGLIAVAVANFALSVFVTLAYLAFTSRMAIETDVGSTKVLYTEDNEPMSALYRYGILAVIGVILQGVLSIFNLSILPYCLSDSRHLSRWCFALALGCLTGMMALTVVMLALGLPRVTK